MSGSLVVFLGPTLRQTEASKYLGAIYRPPAEQGDIVRAVRTIGARTIVLIDGVFAQAPAVRHKEILWALSNGVRIYGAASIGALRAAEMHPHGMQGHGFVYRWYRATLLADDDEVAVAMAPSELGAHALSEPLIDMRLTLRHAEYRGLICKTLRHDLVEMARKIHFGDRTYENLFDCARSTLSNDYNRLIDRLQQWVGENAVRQKRADALSLLRNFSAISAATGPALEPSLFRMTEAWAFDLTAADQNWDDIL